MVEESKSSTLIPQFDQNLVSSEMVSNNQIIQMQEECKRGTLVMRVTPQGRVVDHEILLVTGAYVSGRADDPEFVKKVYVRKLTNEEGKLRIVEDAQYEYDPTLTVVKVGEIDYMDPSNEEFFKPLGNNLF
jgi:hypothetical protein